MINPHVGNVGLHTDGITTIGGRSPGFFYVFNMKVLKNNIFRVANMDTDFVENGSISDNGNIFNFLKLNNSVFSITATRGFFRISRRNGPFHLNNQRSIISGPVTNSLVYFCSSGCAYGFTAFSPSCSAVLRCKACCSKSRTT